MIVSVFNNNKTTQQQISYYIRKIKIVNLPSTYNEYYSRVWLPHQYEKTTMTIVNMCQMRDENTYYLTRHHAAEKQNHPHALDMGSKYLRMIFCVCV